METIAATVAVIAVAVGALFKLTRIFRAETRQILRYFLRPAYSVGTFIMGYWVGVYWGEATSLPAAIALAGAGLFVFIVLCLEAISFILDRMDRISEREP